MAELYTMSFGNIPVAQNIQLANRNGEIYGTLNHVTDVVRSYESVNPDEISFCVHKYVADSDIAEENEVANLWDDIRDFKLIYLPEDRRWFEITVSLDDSSSDVVKSITGIHLEEAELSQLMLYEVEINTIDEDMIRDDYQVTTFYNPDNPKASLLNRILADKAPHYVIHHVDESLYNIQRSFSFDNDSILDALNDIAEEVQCIFVYGEASYGARLVRSISAYDLLDYCSACGERGEDLSRHVCSESDDPIIIKGYGEDTSVFVSVENLAESITYEADADSYKTCFRLEAGDDLMTATVANCNPNGSNYVWYFSDAMRADMSNELSTKLRQYDTEYDRINTIRDMGIPQSYITAYNQLVEKYFTVINDGLIDMSDDAEISDEPETTVPLVHYPITGYTALMDLYYNAMDVYSYLSTTMMPAADAVEDTSAIEQAAGLYNRTMSPIGIASTTFLTQTTMETAIKNYAKVYVDTSRYSIDVITDSTADTVWNGYIKVTSVSDEEDTANSSPLTIYFNDDVATFIKQKIEKALARVDESEHVGIVALFDKNITDFKAELKKYCLTRLASLYEICEDCLDVMVEAGFATGDSSYDGVYVNMYTPYLAKQKAIIEEINVRDAELAFLMKPTENIVNTYYTVYSILPSTEEGIIDVMDQVRNDINNDLDIKEFLGDDLWVELSSFRRDDTYSNNNFKSYDNMTSSELIKQAQDFYNAATKEIKKAGTLQHKITAQIRNLFVMPEFAPIRDRFELMNWIRLAVDGEVYKLRLTRIEVEDDDYESAEVEFSDITYSGNEISDVKNILGSARSISTTYDEVSRQAEKGNTAKTIMNDWTKYGLSLMNQKIVGNAENQNVVYGSTGILLRRIDDLTGEYDDEQVKIINKGLYFSNDSWRTAKVGIGEIIYIDPTTENPTRAYGVNGEAIVGKLILGENLGIYNSSNSLTFNENGLKITNGVNSVYIDPNSEEIFKITKLEEGLSSESMEVFEEVRLLYTNDDGDAVFTGDIYSGNGYIGGWEIGQTYIQSTGAISYRVVDGYYVVNHEVPDEELVGDGTGSSSEDDNPYKIRLDSLNNSISTMYTDESGNINYGVVITRNQMRFYPNFDSYDVSNIERYIGIIPQSVNAITPEGGIRSGTGLDINLGVNGQYVKINSGSTNAPIVTIYPARRVIETDETTGEDVIVSLPRSVEVTGRLYTTGLIKCDSFVENRVLTTSSSGFIVSSNVTTTELNRLSGVTSDVQSQIDSKLSGEYAILNENLAHYVGDTMSSGFGAYRYVGRDSSGNIVNGAPDASSGMMLACNFTTDNKMIVAFSRSGKIFMRLRDSNGWGGWSQLA